MAFQDFGTFEGFDQYSAISEIAAVHSMPNTGVMSLSAVNTPFGFGQSLYCSDGFSERLTMATGLPYAAETYTVWGQVRLKSDGTRDTVSDCVLLSFTDEANDADSGQTPVRVYEDNTGGFYAWGYGATTQEIGVNLRDGAWHLLEVIYYQANSPNGWWQVLVDGAIVAYMSGIDNNYSNYNEQRWFGGCGAEDFYYDDLACGYGNSNSFPGATTIWADRPSDGKLIVYQLNPNADNGTNNWTVTGETLHHDAVDDGASPDDDTTKLTATALSQVEEFGLDDLPTGASSVKKVEARLRMASSVADGLSYPVTLYSKHSTSTDDLADVAIVGTDFSWSGWFDMTTNPSTASVWTPSELNAGILGITT